MRIIRQKRFGVFSDWGTIADHNLKNITNPGEWKLNTKENAEEIRKESQQK